MAKVEPSGSPFRKVVAASTRLRRRAARVVSLVSMMKARVTGRSSATMETSSRATPFSRTTTSFGSRPVTAPPLSLVTVATTARTSSGAASGACAAKSALSSSVPIILDGPFLVATPAPA